MVLYVIVLIFALFSWLKWPKTLGKTAVILLVFAFLLHTFGLLFRMYLQGRPPVWGWDPKENGALLIVMWNAVILHSRWGGFIRERGLAVMSVFGNIVFSLSWFGVKMLGVGLHSYGFTDRAFDTLMTFIASQLVVMALGMLPLKHWRGIQARRKKVSAGALRAVTSA